MTLADASFPRSFDGRAVAVEMDGGGAAGVYLWAYEAFSLWDRPGADGLDHRSDISWRRWPSMDCSAAQVSANMFARSDNSISLARWSRHEK